MKKKILGILLIGVLVIGLTGCGSANKELNSSNSQNQKNGEKVTGKKEVKADTITCRVLINSDKYDKQESIYIYKEGKLYQWKNQKITIKLHYLNMKNGAKLSKTPKVKKGKERVLTEVWKI